jgi:hypothetical protein
VTSKQPIEDGTIKMPAKTPPAASSLPTFVTTTTTTATGSITSWESDPPPVDPLETVEYESWMFLSTADLALDHWNELPGDVVRHAIVEDAVLHARSLCEVGAAPHIMIHDRIRRRASGSFDRSTGLLPG